MSLLILFGGYSIVEDDGGPLPDENLLRAMVDAIQGSDNKLAGKRFTRLTLSLAEAFTAGMAVESTHNFGEDTEGGGDVRLLVNGEVITASVGSPFGFSGLTRGVDSSVAQDHPAGSLVWDLSSNFSALDHVRRGFFVDTAIGSDLDVIARNLGLEKCPGLTDDVWREIIKATAYLAKQTPDAFRVALTALLGAGNFSIEERLISEPWRVFIEIAVALATSLRGRFVLNGGEPALTTGLTTVSANHTIIEPTLGTYTGDTDQLIEGRNFAYPAGALGTAVLGVFDDNEQTRQGIRDGFTNYFLPGGSVVGSVITLGTSPGGIGTPVLVDYTSHSAHHLPKNETVLDADDFFPYLADPLLAARCLVDQIRAAGIRVDVSTML